MAPLQVVSKRHCVPVKHVQQDQLYRQSASGTCLTNYLGKSSCCHLHSAFIRGVNLQVVAIGAVQAQEATARKSSIVTWNMIHRADHTVNWTDASIKTFQHFPI